MVGDLRQKRTRRSGLEAEIGISQPQAEDCRDPPETGKGKERFSSRCFGENRALTTS